MKLCDEIKKFDPLKKCIKVYDKWADISKRVLMKKEFSKIH